MAARCIERLVSMPVFPPYSNESLQYYLWGLRKGFLMPDYEVPDIDISDDYLEIYYAGIRQGEDFAISGYPADRVCYDLDAPHSPTGTIGEAVDLLIEGGGALHTLALGEVLAGGIEAGLFFFMVAIALPNHYEQPTVVYDPSEATALMDLLRDSSGLLSVELYFGGAIDYAEEGCQLQASRFYKSFDGAKSELQDTGRPAWILWSVRTDMSGLQTVDEHGDIAD